MAENAQNLAKLPREDFSNEDFSAIENAVMETGRGRWFLKEYAARNRHAETEKLLVALARIESAMTDKAEETATTADENTISAEGEKIKFDLLDMMTAIANTKREIAAIGSEDENNSHIESATHELDSIVEATEGATSKILETAEKIQEEAWTLREDADVETHCDNLDELSTEIYMACSFQDITGQRTQKVVQVLRYLENRLESMANIWSDESVATPASESDIDFKSEVDQRPDAHLLNGPQLAGEGQDQDDIDLMFVDDEDVQAAAEMEAMLDCDSEEVVAETEAEEAVVETADESPVEEAAEAQANDEEQAAEAEEITFEEDDLVIGKEDLLIEAEEANSAAQAETGEANSAAQAETGEADVASIEVPGDVSPEEVQAPLELSASDSEALFSTHEV